MKKIISLTITIRLLAILFTFIILCAPASQAASRNVMALREGTEPGQDGPPWYDEAWNYRRPIGISNNGDFLPFYQILITLNSTNFNFDLAQPDGADIRFTDSSGRNPLLFWIESWDKPNQLAYLWVLVSSISPEPYQTSIYLYYNNLDAQPIIDGQSPFDFFDDDWCQFPGSGCGLTEETQHFPSGDEVDISKINNQLSSSLINPFHLESFVNGYSIGSDSWITLTAQLPSVSAGKLILTNGVGIKTNNPFQSSAVGFRANYGLGTGREWVGYINGSSGQRTMIGDLPTDVDDLYLINFDNDNSTILEGLNDWHNAYHVYEVRWKPGESIGDIDHGVSTESNLSQVPNTPLPVTLFNNNAVGTPTLMVDWVYVRQFRDPEPTSAVKAQQGLVELSINNSDSPDPIRAGAELTYQVIISNTSSISAPNVAVTDTLPVNVQLVSISASRGSCEPGSVILCDLSSLPANSTATITIIVTPTVDGEIINSAIVSSSGYELDLSDNTSEQKTLVDSIPPVVIWERPVLNGQQYLTFGGWVTLEASATDNSGQVAWVEFRLWDHKGNVWISIGTDTTYPYQVPFNSSILAINDPYQMFVVGVDWAGNESDPYNPRQVIYIERRLPVYLPLLRR
jgi:uncharacterized repeat protein (TIGR01451 family)